MTQTALFRLAPLALIAVATAASAQYTTVQPGAPLTQPIAPGPVGVPGGRSGSIAEDSMASDGWRHQLDRANDGRGGSSSSSKDAARPAKTDELTVGAAIADNKGADVGYIKAVDGSGIVVATAAGQVRVPAEAFGKNKKGLLIGMSKADFDKLVAQAMGS